MKLEIIIPAYNCTSTLHRTLESLTKQTNKNFTVLLVDDCSTEDLTSIVEYYSNKLSIRYIRNEENLGCGMTRQRGIDSTSADYITFLDSDDILLPDAIELWTAAIKESQPDAIYSPFFYVSQDTIKVRNDNLFMCHGKVYNIAFLKQYDIGEHPEVLCIDDAYLNWQVFDLAESVVIIRQPTYVQIDTSDSITHSTKFIHNLFSDAPKANKLAREKIQRFKNNPFKTFLKVQKQVKDMLNKDEAYHKSLIETELRAYLKTVCNQNKNL